MIGIQVELSSTLLYRRGIKDWAGDRGLGIVSKMPEYKILLQNYPSGRKDLSYIQVLTKSPI